MQIPSVLATRATRKTNRFSVRDAKYNAAGAMHRASMGAPELQSNWPDTRKTLGKPGFCSGEDIAQQSYLLVTEDDFAKAAGVAWVTVEADDPERLCNGE